MNRKKSCSFTPPTLLMILFFAQQAWNDLATQLQLAKVSNLTNGRKSKLRARLKEAGGLQGWSIALEKVRKATWMHGANERGWRANFDFMLKPDNFTKLMEGGYDQGRKRAGVGSTGGNGFAALFVKKAVAAPTEFVYPACGGPVEVERVWVLPAVITPELIATAMEHIPADEAALRLAGPDAVRKWLVTLGTLRRQDKR